MEDLLFWVGMGVLGLFVFLVVVTIMGKLYKRSSKEISFVRTGLGGQKVVMNGGTMVVPVFQEIIPVNMNTLRLEVRRANEAALITKDRMRVDVQAEFYVRVKPNQDAIANAAQTLGRRTMNPQSLKELVEGKFVDALRAVAAEMALYELHEQRVDFVQKVQRAVSEDLLKNGLELETVSLTSLDQTNKDYFNPNNAFDAQGLTRLTEEIEARRKQRNDIERETQVAIELKNLEAEKQSLEITRNQEYARMMQEREVAVRRAEESASTAREQAEREREAEQARIAAKQQVNTAEIMSERAVEEERIDKDRVLREKEIIKQRMIETAEIERRKTVQLTEQDRSIAVSEKSKSESEAAAEADEARALAVRARERVTTVQETEIAERQKAIELVEAAREAERAAIGITVAAEAEKNAALDRAEAKRTEASAEADQAKIVAQGEADAEVARAEAAERRYAVEAAGKRALNEAQNILSADIVAMQIKMATIEHLEGIIRESVKPMERIDGIKIFQVDGLAGGGGGNGHASGNGHGGEGSLSDQVVNAALRYRTQAPLLDSLLKEVGMSGDLAGMTRGLRPDVTKPSGKSANPEIPVEEESMGGGNGGSDGGRQIESPEKPAEA